MGKCAVKNCKNVSHFKNKSEGITFHKVPKDYERRMKWTKIIRLLRKETDWIPTKTTVICSKHFRDHDKIAPKREGGHVRLSEKAFPMLVDDYDEEQKIIENMDMDWIDEVGSETYEEMEELIETPSKCRIREYITQQKCVSTDRLKKIKDKNNRLKAKNTTLHNIIVDLKNKRLLSEEEEIQLNVSDEMAQLIEQFKKIYEKEQTFRKIPYALKKFALTLNFYSPAAYKYVRLAFNNSLPHPRALCKWYGRADGGPGFTLKAFNALKVRSSNSKSKILCNLVIDEMAICQQKINDGDSYRGYVDYGLNDQSPGQNLASSALVLLLVCLNQTWKTPIGYFFTHGLTASKLAIIINLALTKCADTNVEVASVTCDGSQTNIAAMRVLGCKLNDPNNLRTTFPHPTTGEDVALFLDACHMLKLVRNTFASKKVFFNGTDEVHWKYVKRLLETQGTQGFKTENKLRSRHVHFQNQIMQVKLASQLLSDSVAQSLHLAKDVFPGFENCEPTAEFVKLHNDVFDVLNSHADTKAIGFKKALEPQTKHEIFELIKKYKHYIQNFKVQIIMRKKVKSRGSIPKIVTKKYVKNLMDCKFKTGFLGFLICLESLKALYARLVSAGLLKYIATYRLSQDHIELFFGCIRSNTGHNNPNVVQFKSAYKMVLNNLEIKSNSRKCIPLENINVLTDCSGDKKDHIKVINMSSFYRHDDTDDSKMNLKGLHESTKRVDLEQLRVVQQIDNGLFTNTEEVVGYISSDVVERVGRQLECDVCVRALLAFEWHWFHKLIGFKDKGYYPSVHVFEICVNCERVIRHALALSPNKSRSRRLNVLRLATASLQKLQNNSIINEFAVHPGDHLSSVQTDHSLLLINAIIHKYIEIRLYHEIK